LLSILKTDPHGEMASRYGKYYELRGKDEWWLKMIKPVEIAVKVRIKEFKIM